jgi:hypothetical protein
MRKTVVTSKHSTNIVSNRGFALVATLSLMVLLTLVALGMLSLSAVTLRSTSQDSAAMEARANARLALMIALGELQKGMGPDQRISSRAMTLVQDQRLGATLSPDNPRSWWVGAVGTNPTLGLDATKPVSLSNPAAVWLVSGLDPAASAANQLTQPFAKPVEMFGEHSINLTMTGGKALTAGIVEVVGGTAGRIGGYAYLIDDEGMKAALAPSNDDLVNTSTPVSESDLTPGAYDVSVLDGMAALDDNPLSNYSKILSTGDLVLIGGNKQMAASKRLSYTTYSRGVLSDAKNGGLKRDLTVAFEDEATFAAVFPRGTGAYTADYLCMDPVKLAASPELLKNGYIHWEVFKDHYNIKQHIKTAPDGTKYLDPVRYSKEGPWLPGTRNGDINGPSGSKFTAGMLGPHDIGDDNFFTNGGALIKEMPGIPYGDYKVYEVNPRTPKNHGEFKHSPVIPVLQRFQVNAWMEQPDAKTLRTHAQMWSSHYNPYNIALYVGGASGGPRLLATPSITADSTSLNTINNRSPRSRFGYFGQSATNNWTIGYLRSAGFTHGKGEFQGKVQVMLLPGRSHVLGYENATDFGQTLISDGALYSDKVKDLTTQSVFRDLKLLTESAPQKFDIPTDLPATYDIKFNIRLDNAALHQGVDDNNGGPGNFELHQTFWAPFAWEKVSLRPGKLFDMRQVTAATLNENMMAMQGFNLRTTREPNSSIRPLVDANIRCLFGNTRWDSPLNVEALAAYSIENQGVQVEMNMDMDVSDDPKGYTYWGAGRDPSFGYDRVILFDIPRADLVSLGQLQHAGAGRFSYEPTYIVGNSYANPRISQDKWKESVTDTFSTDARGLGPFPINGAFNLYDASYLVNEVLWDRYTFTTIPQVANNLTNLTEPAPNDAHFKNLAAGNADLPNARYLPYAPSGSSFNWATLRMASDKAAGTGAFYHNAGHLLVDGAFNVNSVSVDAWEAFLSSTHSLPVAKVNEKSEVTGFDMDVATVRFPRTNGVFGGGINKGSLDENYWIGFRELKQPEVRELAQAIVEEVKKRGPFLSMADFVNRKLKSGELGESGALQAALDKTVNSGIDDDFSKGKQGAGFPGQLLQGDLLQALAPRMTVRSDVFTIRAYGESKDAVTGVVLAQAWCEAIVQRVPDPMDPGNSGGSALKELSNPSSPFGREFRMISFRWLNPEEI